ncbi:MAG TPA: DNA polymerase III subunit delta' [Frankiaceae bacterium]|nr:DNA polymerase III subunit delta' [Frankiaceae bacterium]
MSVWDALVGQPAVVATLSAAAEAATRVPGEGPLAAARAGMTHSWLFTGPAGSGRSVAARAFAAALSCRRRPVGCGECVGCRTVLAGTAADVRVVRPEGLSIGVAEVRALVRDAASAPAAGPWRVLLLEDADRLTEQAANALLKALEEPADRAVLLLCAPSTEDVLPTVRSRCRVVPLTPPAAAEVAAVLSREGVDPALAALAAQAAQGHVGRARRLATDEAARARRAEVLRLPTRLRSVADCLAAAADLVAAATEEAEQATATRDEQEAEALRTALGAGGSGGTGRGRAKAVAVRGAAGMIKDLERAQKSRGKRSQLDALDRALVDLAGWYRDVLVVQLGAPVELVHPDQGRLTGSLARASAPEQTLRRVEAVVACREALAGTPGLAPLLAVESLALALRAG